MAALDMNLLVALDALLEEESVTRAAERLRTSAPAMSRTLARIRRVLGDPVLVRAGRQLVPTPRALELRPEVHALVQQARTLLMPGGAPDPASLSRQFTVQASDVVLAALAAPLIEAASAQAPGVTLRFLPESLEGTPALREARVDLEVGVIDHADPETHVEVLGTDRPLGAVRTGHPLASKPVTPRAFAAAAHIAVSRLGHPRGPIDERLDELGLQRRVTAVVPSHPVALLLTHRTDLVCMTPEHLTRELPEALHLHTFPIPLDLPHFTLGMAWHPRNERDGAHRWLRERVREVLAAGEGTGKRE